MNLNLCIRLGFLWISLSLPVLAQCVSIPISLEERTMVAEQIVLGKLKSKQAYWGPDRRQIFTLNVIEVTAYLKGAGGDEVALVTLGGFIGDKGQVTTPSLQVTYDQEYVLFLTSAGPEMSDEALSLRPDLQKMTAYADAQGAMKKQAGFYHDLYSEPRQTENAMFNRIATLTGAIASTPNGEHFEAREGITGIFDTLAAPITSITPSTTNAGTIASSDFITINGSGFGAESNVFYANADDGGATFTGSGVASDNISWSDTQIINKPAGKAGTGTVLVNGQTSSITVNYAHTEINSDFSGFGEVTRQRYNLADVDGNGGLTFQYNTSFAANTAAVDAFERSLETWRCEVLINYGVNTATTSAIATAANDGTNIVTFDASLPAGVLGRATSYFSGRANGSCNQTDTLWYAEELDIQFKPNPPTPGTTWNFGPGATAFSEHDFESVSLHELGHAMGLGHTIAPGTVMHFSISSGQDLRTPNANEIAGVNARLAFSTGPYCFTPSAINGPMVLLTPGTCSLNGVELDLQVGKTVTDLTPEEGDTLTYTITVTNLGASEATTVSLTDILPNGVTRTATAPNPSQGAFNDGNGIWTIGTIAGMANATLQLEVTVDAGASSLGPIANTTSALTLDQTDTNSANDVGSVTINVSDDTDLAVTKMVSNATPDEGETLTYTITVTNNGPARATNVRLTDILPNGVTRTATAPNTSQGSFNDGNGLWTIGTLNDSAAATLGLEVSVDAGASSLSQPITNATSGLSLDQTDTQSGNNTGSVDITVSDDTDLAVTKMVSNTSPDEGETLTYTITVTNNGPARATNVRLTDILPSGITRTATAPNTSQGSFNDGNGLWTIGTLNDSAVATLGLEVTVDAGASSLSQPITNTTSGLTLDQTDIQSGNNTGSVGITVSDNTDLVVTKMVSNNTPLEGSTITYTINVTNNGPARATNISLTDSLPNGVTRTATPPNASQGSFNDGSGLWTIGTLEESSSATLNLEVTVDAGASALAQPITNTTSGLTLDQTDTQSANNVGTVNITVSDDTDLAVTKTVDMDNPCQGDVVQFTITIVNNGPTSATSVVLTDALPAGLVRTATPVNASQGSFSEVTGIWSVGTLADGAMADLMIETEVTGTGTITNSTSALGLDQTDNNPNNNVGSVPLEASSSITITTDPADQSACIGQLVNFSVVATGGGLSYQWFKDGNSIAMATSATLAVTVSSAGDAGMYHCEVTNICDTETSLAATLTVDETGSLAVSADPSTIVRGLDPVMLNAVVECAGPNVDLLWTNLTTNETSPNNPWIINDVPETTTYEVEVMDGQTLATATAQITVLVSQNPDFFDLNNDGCNNLLDLYLAIQDWNMPFLQDPNGDGFIDVRDLMYIHIDEGTPCP